MVIRGVFQAWIRLFAHLLISILMKIGEVLELEKYICVIGRCFKFAVEIEGRRTI